MRRRKSPGRFRSTYYERFRLRMHRALDATLSLYGRTYPLATESDFRLAGTFFASGMGAAVAADRLDRAGKKWP